MTVRRWNRPADAEGGARLDASETRPKSRAILVAELRVFIRRLLVGEYLGRIRRAIRVPHSKRWLATVRVLLYNTAWCRWGLGARRVMSMTASAIDLERTLRERFGLERFRPGQRAVIES